MQAPLKQLYRDDPLSSRTPLEATASFETAGVTTLVQTWSGPVRAGLHPATGDAHESAMMVAVHEASGKAATMAWNLKGQMIEPAAAICSAPAGSACRS